MKTIYTNEILSESLPSSRGPSFHCYYFEELNFAINIIVGYTGKVEYVCKEGRPSWADQTEASRTIDVPDDIVRRLLKEGEKLNKVRESLDDLTSSLPTPE